MNGAAFRRLACAAGATAVACAPNAVTLRSQHYRVHVPAGWQVVEEGGAPEIPTLIKIPTSDRALELRIYAWPAQGPLADPTGEAFKRLGAAGVLDLATATADDDEPCPDRPATFTVLGTPARAIHVRNAAGQRITVTGGHLHGSLVGVIGLMAAGSSSCGDTNSVDAVVLRLCAGLAGPPDSTRPWVPPTIGGTQGIPIPPIDPNAPTP